MTSLEVLIEPYKEWVMNDASLVNDVSELVHKNSNDEYTLEEYSPSYSCGSRYQLKLFQDLQ